MTIRPTRRAHLTPMLIVAAAPAAIALSLYSASGDARGVSLLAEVPFPADNPITEAKRVLGKALFFDEQLSADNTVACASCHQHSAGGADPRLGVNPGFDTLFGTPDDVRGSPGVIAQDDQADYASDPIFALQRQVTGRSANPVINAAYFQELFWDGRASDVLVDPDTGGVVLDANAALEVQALAPPLSTVEMGHAERDWDQIADKLAFARPLALASDVPPDIADAVLAARTYPKLFEDAFGDRTITASRIAMAIATYERTLISDATPWDAFVLGDPGALSPAEARGWGVFQTAQCTACHTPPLFTSTNFRNIGLRPPDEDTGRAGVTGDPFDRGKFKVSGLRNAGLKRTFMHNGQFVNLQQVVAFYAGNNKFPENLDPSVANIQIAPPAQQDLVVFLQTGLTDPRVAAETFPFDAPDLFFSPGNTPNPRLLPGGGRPDSLGRVPQIIALTPPLIGSDDFKIGVTDLPAGATATLVASQSPPVGAELFQDLVIAQTTASDPNNAGSAATARWPIPFSPALDGEVYFLQWRVDDPGQTLPALSRVARVEFFCGFGACATGCMPDFTRDQSINFYDVAAFINAFNAHQPEADLAPPLGVYNFFDISAFVAAYNAGCP